VFTIQRKIDLFPRLNAHTLIVSLSVLTNWRISKGDRGDGEATAPRGHLVVAGPLEVLRRFHEFLNFGLIFEPLIIGGQLGQVGQASRLEHLVLFQHLPKDEIRPSEIVASEPLIVPKEIFKGLHRLRNVLRISGTFDFEIDPGINGVAQFDETGAEVAKLLSYFVASVLLRIRFAEKVVFPGQVAHDGAALAQFRVTVDVIRQIREIKSKRELFLEPAITAELRPVGDFVRLVLEFDFGISEHQADGLSQTANLPVSQDRHCER